MATGLVCGKKQILTLYRINTLQPTAEKFAQVITPATLTSLPNLVQIRTELDVEVPLFLCMHNQRIVKTKKVYISVIFKLCDDGNVTFAIFRFFSVTFLYCICFYIYL